MTVFLVGAGPGGADLVTLRAARLLAEAEAVVFDRLVDPEVLALCSREATLVDVGKSAGEAQSQAEINELLVRLGQRLTTVVRLKGGDPFLFGRGGEEAAALVAAAVPVEVVPGVSSALAAPALAGIAVTHRGTSGAVTVVSAVGLEGSPGALEAGRPDHTLVVLMGAARRAAVATRLVAAGWSLDAPVCVVERAATCAQRVTRGRLGDLARMAVASPAVIVVGEVAREDHLRGRP